MHRIQKWLSLTLILLITLYIPVGLAEGKPSIEDAIAAGREISYAISANWHGIPELDEETNKTISSLVDAIEITSSFALPNQSTAYSRFEMTMNGDRALWGEAVFDETTGYVNSPAMGRPFALGLEDIAKYYENLGTWLENNMAESDPDFQGIDISGMYASIGQSLSDQALGVSAQDPVAAMVEYEAFMNDLGMEPIGDAFEKWLETAATGEPYEDTIASVFGVAPQKAMVYQITKDELVALLQELMSLIKNNDALWQYVIDTTNASLPPEQKITLTEEDLQAAKAELDTMASELEMAIPDGMTAQYIECYDDAGVNNLGIVQLLLETGEAEPFEAYIEWIPNESSCAAYIGNSEGNIQFLAEPLPEEAVELDGQPAVQKGCKAMLSTNLFSREPVILEAICASQESDSANGFVFSVGIGDGEMVTGVKLTGDQKFSYNGPDAVMDGAYVVSTFVGDANNKILTVNVSAKTGEPSGMPFDPHGSAMEFVYPGQMDEAAFADWMENDVTAGTMQSAFRILSALPSDVFAEIMTTTMDFQLDIQ